MKNSKQVLGGSDFNDFLAFSPRALGTMPPFLIIIFNSNFLHLRSKMYKSHLPVDPRPWSLMFLNDVDI